VEVEQPTGSGVRQVSLGRWLLETLLMVLLAIGIAFLVRTYIVQPYQVPTSSMAPTIEIGDQVIASKFIFYLKDPERGDVVVLDDPTGSVDTLIKRVIAVGGQTVDLIDGRVVVDGLPLDEPYVHDLPSEPQVLEMPYMVPAGHVWLMGDNRTNSMDSRTFGAVSTASVHGEAFVIYWPYARWGTL